MSKLKRNQHDISHRFMTANGTWNHYSTPETKRGFQIVSFPMRIFSPKNATVTISANQAIATVFWDARCIFQVKYLEKGKTKICEKYFSSLDSLNHAVNENVLV